MESVEWWSSLGFETKNTLISTMFLLFKHSSVSDQYVSKSNIHDMLKLETVVQEKDNLINKLISELSTSQETKNKIDVIIDSIHTVNTKNNIKGLAGELLVDSIINSRWSGDETLVDTSRIKGKGDRIVHLDKVDIIVEVKNLAQSTMNSSLKKYKQTLINDIVDAKESDGICVGVLCNTSPASFKCDDKLTYQMENTKVGKVFIICVTNVQEYSFLLKAALHLACVITELIKDSEYAQNQDLLNVIREIFPTLNEILLTVLSSGKLINNLKTNNATVKRSIENVIDSIKCVLNPEIKDTIKCKLDTISDFYKMLNDDKITLEKFKTECISNNIDISVIRKYGFKKIKQYQH
jgi:hypothetical protein